MKRSLMLPIGALVAFSFMTWHLVQTNSADPPARPPVQPGRSPYNQTIAGAGIVEPRSENIAVAAVVPGTVAEVFVQVGQRVPAGAKLFRLDDRQRKADLAIQQARLAQSTAELSRMERMPRREDVPPSEARVHRAEAELKSRKDDLDRTETLVSQKVTTQQELIQRQQAYLVAKAEQEQAEAEHARLLAGAWEEDLAVARAQVAMAKEAVSQAEIELERLVVTSPIDATVLKVDVRPGEYVGTPPGQPLIILGDIAVMHVRVDIDEQDLPRFREGLPGQGFIRGDTQHPFQLTFVRIEPFVEPKRSLTNAGTERVDTRVLQVIYAVEPGGRLMFVGQQIDVFLDTGETDVSDAPDASSESDTSAL